MAVVYHEIYLPIDTESTFDYIVIKQGDAGTHRVRATLISNNRVYTIPTSGASYFMKFRKPDNNYCLVEATVSDNTISAEVTEEMLRVSGTGRGEFMIVSGSDELKTATFHVKIVKETFTSGDVQSHSDFAPFAALLQGAGAAASNANTAAAAANAAASLAEQKAQAIPDDYSDLVAEVEEVKADLGDLTPGLSQDARAALLACIEHVAWVDEHGQTYYNALEDALYPDSALVSITAVFTQGSTAIYQTTPLNDLKAYLVVTGHYNDGTSNVITDYSLSGVLTVGTSTVTVNVNGKTTTFTVTVSAPYWDYEWDASSESMPTNLTYHTAEFITRNDEKLLKVTNPNLDFNYVGDCELEIVGKWEIFYPAETYWNGEPQFIVVAADHGADGKDGFKTYCLTAKNNNYVFTSASGSNQATQIDGVAALRTYNLKFENGSVTLKVDDNVIASGTGVHNNNYLNFTGIYSVFEAEYAGMVIKAIKFKQL